MQILYGVNSIRSYVAQQRQRGLSCGLVPTMGALHAGHIALLKQARLDNDLIVCSVYVNPTQFNNRQDLDKYPRNLEQDIQLLERADCDVLFCPDDKVMYPRSQEHTLKMDFGPMSCVLEGEFRPGHFSGVGLVVAKLLNIVRPDRAYFGQKDLQQCSIVNKLIKDLFLEVELVTVPTVREQSGLAMSSRNKRLTTKGRKMAANLYAALQVVQEALNQKIPVEKARQQGYDAIARHPKIRLEYLEVIDRDRFEIVTEARLKGRLSVCIAAYVDGVRLIDNVPVFF